MVDEFDAYPPTAGHSVSSLPRAPTGSRPEVTWAKRRGVIYAVAEIGGRMKLYVTLALCVSAAAQEPHQHAAPPAVPLQPLAQQARQLEEAMAYLGQPFGAADLRRMHEAIANPNESAAVQALESVLDAHALLIVDINPESRVKVEEGTAKPELVEAGTRLFLVKVVNKAHVRAPLVVQSPNSGDVYVRSNGDP